MNVYFEILRKRITFIDAPNNKLNSLNLILIILQIMIRLKLHFIFSVSLILVPDKKRIIKNNSNSERKLTQYCPLFRSATKCQVIQKINSIGSYFFVTSKIICLFSTRLSDILKNSNQVLNVENFLPKKTDIEEVIKTYSIFINTIELIYDGILVWLCIWNTRWAWYYFLNRNMSYIRHIWKLYIYLIILLILTSFPILLNRKSIRVNHNTFSTDNKIYHSSDKDSIEH